MFQFFGLALGLLAGILPVILAVAAYGFVEARAGLTAGVIAFAVVIFLSTWIISSFTDQPADQYSSIFHKFPHFSSSLFISR